MNPHSNQRGLLNFRFLGILGLLLIFIIGVAYFFYGLQPSVQKGESQEFKIVKGEGIKEIGARLSQLFLIKSISVFKLYSLISGNAQKFKPGVYELAANMSVPQIVRILTQGEVKEVKLAIQEGSTLKDVDSQLLKAGVLVEGSLSEAKIEDLADDYQFLKEMILLEGFIFPDTYQFELAMTVEEVMEKFLDNFQEKAWPLLKGERDWYNRLILASLLEREVPEFTDRQLVAGILLKRLTVDMPLQVDATVTYAKCDGEIKNCPNPLVRKGDLTITSPYNTYQNLGLPPTPIANAGQAAIKAALSPQPSQYWYYLSASDTKETIFSKTLEEHNLNRVKYL